jgi:hypothetical protein
LYGCKVLSLILREKHRLKVFDTRLLRNTFGPQRDEVKGKWRSIHSKEFYDLYFFTNIISTIKSRTMKEAGNMASMGDKRGTYKGLVGKPKGNKPLGRSEHRLGDNIKWIFK